MPNSNKEKQQFLLIELLENFSKKELKGLRHFVSCRYFNTDQYVVNMLEVLVNAVIGKKKMDETVRKYVHVQVFGKSADRNLGKKEKATFNAKMNALTRLAERFLIAEALEKKEAYKSDLLLEKLLKKKQYQLFNRHINKVQKQTKDLPQDSEYHEHQLKINQHRLDYLFVENMLRKTDNLHEINQQLDLRYLLNKLDIYLTANSFQKFFKGKSYAFLNSKEINYLSSIPQYAQHPVVSVYLASIKLTLDRSYENYDKLFGLLTAFEKEIHQRLRNDSFTTLSNFCTYQIKSGHTDFYTRQFDLFLTLDKKDLLLVGRTMPIHKFKNIITAACHVGNYDWAEQAIERYIPFVEKNNRENVKYFNLGAVAFYRKDYDLSKAHFTQIDKSISPIYDLNLRVIIAKREYEVGEDFEFTRTTMESTEKHIYESRMKEEDKAPYKKFIRMLINLFNIKHKIGKKTLKNVKKELKATQHISDKKWLEDKIHELETNPPKIS